MQATPGSTLDPGLPQIEDSAGVAITPLVAEADRADGTESLLLAQLAPGVYTMQVGGDNATFGAFQMSVFLPGDLDGDGVVDDSEHLLAAAATAQTEGNLNPFTERFFRENGIDLTKDLYQEGLDANRDGVVDNFDLSQAGANLNNPVVELTLVGDQDPPVIDVYLVNDDGRGATDGIVSDPTLGGTVTDGGGISAFQGRFVATPANAYTDLLANVDANGNVSIGLSTLATMTNSPVVDNGGTLQLVDGIYTLELYASDEYGNVHAAPDQLVFTVISQNDTPLAIDDADTTDEDTPTAGNVLDNDSDVDVGDNLVVASSAATSTLGAAVTVDTSGNYTYDPTGSATLQALAVGDAPLVDTFDYTIEDAMGAQATATVSVTVSGLNDAPVADVDTGSTDEDTSVVIDVLANDTDPDTGDTQTVQSVDTAGTQGAVANNGTNVTYNPNGAFEGLAVGDTATDTFSYTMIDGQGVASTATVTVTISGVNDAPVAAVDTRSTDEDTSVVIDVLANDTDPDTGDTQTVQSVDTTGTQGAVANNGTNVTYNPNGAFEGLAVGDTATDTFSYTMVDGQGVASTATVTVTITGVNDAPVPTVDTGSTNEDTSVVIDVLANDTDPDTGDTQAVQSVDLTGTQGRATRTNNGADVTYDPNGAFDYLVAGGSATDTFSYTVVDSQGATATTTVTVTISGLNDAPVVADQQLSVNPDLPDPVTVGTIAVIDPDLGDTHTFVVTASDSTHFVVDGTTGLITAPDTTALDPLTDGTQFTLTVDVTDQGGTGQTDVGSIITITVRRNQPPVAQDDALSTDEDSPVSGNVFDDNGSGADSDAEGDTFVVIDPGTNVAADNGGLYTLDAVGNVTYSPNGQFDYLAVGESDADTFSYTIQDSQGGTDSATVTVAIAGVNDAPAAVADTGNANADATAVIDVLGNDTDPDTNDTKSVQGINTTGTQGSVVNNGTNVTYNPNGAFDSLVLGDTATDTFSYTMADGQGATSTATVTVTITGVNDAPAAVADTASTDEDTSVVIDVLANDTDPDTGDTQAVQSVDDSASQGTVTDNGANVTYDPNGAFEYLSVGESATDTFSYTMIDGQGATATATVTVTITGLNDAPVVTAAGPTGTTDEDTPATYNLTDLINGGAGTTTVTDADTSDIVGGVALVGALGNGTLAYSLDGTTFTDVTSSPSDSSALLLPSSAQIRYTPDGVSTETATLTFRAWDATSGSAGQTGVNTTPNGGSTPFSAATDTLSLTVTEVNNTGVRLVALPVPTPKEEFDVFVANLTTGNIGQGRFFMDSDGTGPLSYRLIYLTGVDLDGTRTPADTNDDVTALTFRDNLGNIVFDILADDDLQLDGTSGIATGEWEDIGTHATELYNGELFVYLETAGGNYKVSGNNIKPSAEVTTLPTSLTTVNVGDTYVIEVWVQDDFASSTGLTAVSVDMAFDRAFASAGGTGNALETPFDLLYGPGSIDNITGAVSGIGGGTIFPGIGLSPAFARLGYVEFTASAATLAQEYTIDVIEFTQRGQASLDPSQFSVESISVAQGNPLHGTETSNAMADISMSLVLDPTPSDSSGRVVDLPKSEAWIDEWDSFWVELWVDTSDGVGVTSGSVDLAYNTQYFTATEIDHGPAYMHEASGSIDDGAGLVADLGGTAALPTGGGYALLSRVKFESLSNDQVPVNTNDQFTGSYDLGLDLRDAQIEVAGGEAVEVGLGPAPGTELWSVAYDLDDDGRIGFSDLAQFAGVFQEEVAVSGNPFASACDFDNSGRVDFGDLAYFASSFREQKGSDVELQFPASFTQRWIGSLNNAEGPASLGELLDAATETWRDALALDEPINVQLVVQDFADSQLGQSQILEVDAEGIPVRGLVTIDDDGAGLGWHMGLDTPVAEGKYDLYSVLLHEVGHAYGFTSDYDGFATHVETVTDGQVVFTSQDADAQLDTLGQHLDMQAHAGDLMDRELAPSVRELPSQLDVEILLAAHEAARAGATGFSSNASAITAAAAPAPEAVEIASDEVWNQGESAPVADVWNDEAMLDFLGSGLAESTPRSNQLEAADMVIATWESRLVADPSLDKRD